MSKEELKELKQGGGVNIAGTIDSFKNEPYSNPGGPSAEYNLVNVKSAYCIDHTIYGVFIIRGLNFKEDKGEFCQADAIQMLNGVPGDTVYNLFFDEETLSTLHE